MFTGIVEELGKLKSINGCELTIECNEVLSQTKVGDSISINGCCQTVVSITPNSFTVNVSEETFNVTNFKYMRVNDCLNLERALTLTTRMGGHIVQGHVDEVAEYLGDMKFKVQNSKYIVYKGSIAVNGVSLTVASIEGNIFSVAVIPHTLQNTNLKMLKVGDIVNIETDIIGRYVEKLLLGNNKSRIDEKFLIENGFI